MRNVDFVLGGELSRQHQQDIHQQVQQARFAHAVELAQHSQTTKARHSEMLLHYAA